jgi:hypothetical protein
MKATLFISSTTGVTLKVAIIGKSERYGRNGALISDRAMVEFYDSRYPHTINGQLVSRYYVETLREHGLDSGLLLDPASPDWRIDGDALASVNLWVRLQLSDSLAIGQRVQVIGYGHAELRNATGKVTAIEGQGMCPVMVLLDVPHPRLGAQWAFPPSSLVREHA